MNVNHHNGKLIPTTLRRSVMVALMFQAVAASGQLTITKITVPGATSIVVSSLNSTGQVSGYYLIGSAQRAFFWSEGNGVDLGTLGGASAVGNALNNLGAVVGYASLAGDTKYHAFVYSDGAMLDLGSFSGSISSAAAINDAGQITGYAYTSPFNLNYHAFRWSGNVLQDLGTLGGALSYGVAINSLGQVAGDSTLSSGQNHAFLHSDGVMRDLRTLGGSESFAFAINELGHVTGQSSTHFNLQTHAFFFDGTSMRDLGTLGGTFSAGYKLNDLGQVIGDSYLNGDTANRGFIFQNGSMQNLGTLGGDFSSAWAINNLGQIVGVSSDSLGQQRAFVWQNNAMTDLNTLLPADSGWELTGAYFINDAGHVVGDGFYLGQYQWYRLNPATEENHSPVADAGADLVAECTSGVALIGLNAGASHDPDGDAMTYEWSESGVLLGTGVSLSISIASGSHTLTLRVTDAHGASAEDFITVSVVDSSPPALLCPVGQSASANASGVAVIPDVLPSLIAIDSCTESAHLVKTQSPLAGTVVGLGSHTITVTVSDTAGHQAFCTTTFTVTDVTPPTVQCPESVTTSANAQGLAIVPNLVAGLVASDNCTASAALILEQNPVAGSTRGFGNHTLTLSVSDATGNRTICSVNFTVVDSTSPIVETPSEIISAATSDCQGSVPDLSLQIVASDNCTPANELVFVQEPAAGTMVGRGDHEIQVSVTDAAGNSTTRVVLLRIMDQTPPEIISVVASSNQLSPPNRKMMDVSLSVIANDGCDASVINRIVSVTSNEPVTGPDDTTAPDWVITSDLTVSLRAEVASQTEARVYTIQVMSIDQSGNTAFRSLDVNVQPKGKKGRDSTADQGSGKK